MSRLIRNPRQIAIRLATGVSLGMASLAMAQTSDLEGKWVLSVGEDPSSYKIVASLQQDAANTIKDEYATKDVTPRLMLHCTPGNPELGATIDWQRFISSFNTEVGFKIDGGKTLWLKWGVDSSNKITRSRSAADSMTLIEQLKTGRSLLVEISPYSESPVTVEYDLSGIGEGLDRLIKECS
jgi:type VI secretion system protein VasI